MSTTETPIETGTINTVVTNGKSEARDETLKTHISFATKQYNKFDFIKGNRGISESHIKTLVEKIKSGENYLVFSPIMVDEQLRVLDGQHRLLAAMKANVHIWYNVVTGKINLDTIARINDSQRRWNPSNFVSMYAVLGNIHYKAFEQFYRGYKLSVSTALLLFGKQTMTTLRSGKLVATDVLGAEKIADALIDVQKYVKFAKYNRFTDAFMRVFGHPEYDHKRMMLKLKQRKDTIKKLTSVNDYIRLLEGIYNYAMPSKSTVRFF